MLVCFVAVYIHFLASVRRCSLAPNGLWAANARSVWKVLGVLGRSLGFFGRARIQPADLYGSVLSKNGWTDFPLWAGIGNVLSTFIAPYPPFSGIDSPKRRFFGGEGPNKIEK